MAPDETVETEVPAAAEAAPAAPSPAKPVKPAGIANAAGDVAVVTAPLGLLRWLKAADVDAAVKAGGKIADARDVSLGHGAR